MKWLVTRGLTLREERNKESLCADRLSNLNSLRLAVFTRHRLHVFIKEEGWGHSAHFANTLHIPTAVMEMDTVICLRQTVSFVKLGPELEPVGLYKSLRVYSSEQERLICTAFVILCGNIFSLHMCTWRRIYLIQRYCQVHFEQQYSEETWRAVTLTQTVVNIVHYLVTTVWTCCTHLSI